MQARSLFVVAVLVVALLTPDAMAARAEAMHQPTAPALRKLLRVTADVQKTVPKDKCKPFSTSGCNPKGPYAPSCCVGSSCLTNPHACRASMAAMCCPL